MNRIVCLLSVLGLVSLTGCATRYNHFVRLVHDEQSELGVATDQGILFTGRNLQEGEVEIWSTFQSEQFFQVPGSVARFEENLGLIETPANFLPLTISDRNPLPDDDVQIAGLGADGDVWYLTAYVPEDSANRGSILSCDDLWEMKPEDIAGAAVLVWRDESWQLAGLVWARLEISGRRYAAYADVREISRVYRGNADYLEPPAPVKMRGINTIPDY
ncbi:MAG: hypothetical protein RL885_00790 [Planctomycetota bacterium]